MEDIFNKWSIELRTEWTETQGYGDIWRLLEKITLKRKEQKMLSGGK